MHHDCREEKGKAILSDSGFFPFLFQCAFFSSFSVRRSGFFFSFFAPLDGEMVPHKQWHCHIPIQLKRVVAAALDQFSRFEETAVMRVLTYLVSLAARSMCSTRAWGTAQREEHRLPP